MLKNEMFHDEARHLNKMRRFRSSAAARRHVATSDPPTHGLSVFEPMQLAIELKSTVSNARLPRRLLEATKAEARAQGISYTRYVRMVFLLENTKRHQRASFLS